MHRIYAYREELKRRIIAELSCAPQTNQWSADVSKRLHSFISRGKLIRGCLVLASCKYNGCECTEDVWKVAIAVEFLHSGLLILDDIMDQDDTRRGSQSIPSQYADIMNSSHAGMSLAMCAGSITFFWAYRILSQIKDDRLMRKMTQIISDEYMAVGYGQMQDLAFSSGITPQSRKQILALYKYKTARYTFSVPLTLGSICAHADQDFVSQIDKIGEDIGILFQIKDDELGIFGKGGALGKPVGSDISEDKKTIYWYKYRHSLNAKGEILKLFGSKDLTIEDIEKVRSALIESGAYSEIQNYVAELEAKIQSEINELQCHEEFKNSLSAMVNYLRVRQK